MAAEHPEAAPRILGLTGPIACGKTTVGNILLELGALERIDADEVVHELMAAGTKTTDRIAAAFGRQVLAPDGAVDRKALGVLVFEDGRKLRTLEEIVHPAVRPTVRARIAALAGREGVVVVDAVKLLQSELADLCDAIWVIRCSPSEEMRRLIRDRGMDQAAARGRLDAQPSFDDPRVTAVIENDGSIEELKRKVRELFVAAYPSAAFPREAGDAGDSGQDTAT